MILKPSEERLIRLYLLGDLPEDRARELEKRLILENDLVERVRLVEDEVIEDYVRGALSPHEVSRFQNHFLTTPRRRRKLMLVEGLRKHAVAAPDDLFQQIAADAPRRASRLATLFTPGWRAAALAVLVLAAGGVVWRAYFFRSDVERGMVALNRAYRERRPLQARISGMDYAPFTQTRGPEQDGVDKRARDLSASLLQNAAADDSSAATLHALGRLYLSGKEFDKAVREFGAALKLAPQDARLHADLGAALLEKGRQEQSRDPSGRGEMTLAESLKQLDKALALDDSLPEARFNRALLYQMLHLRQQAREDWEKYLAQDPHSRWADEARRNLELIKEQADKVSRRETDLFEDFLQARQSGDEERVWEIFSRGHLRTGNVLTSQLVNEYLDFASKGERAEADNRLQALAHLGRLSEQRADDRFTSELARSYDSKTPEERRDLLRARELVRQAYEIYNRSQNGRAIELYTQAKTLFTELDDTPELLLADYWIAHCYLQQPDVERSASAFTGLIAACETQRYKWLQALALNGLANTRARALHYSRAVEDGWKSYRLAARIGDANGLLRGLSTLASLYRNLGRYQQSLRLASEGFRLADEVVADPSQVIGLYATSAWNFNATGHYGLALEYGREAVSLGAKMNNNPLALSRYHVQMGLIYAKLKNYDEARRNIRRGLEIGQGVKPEKIGDEMTSYALLYLGRVERESGAFPDALAALEQVIQFCRERNEVWLLHEARKERLLAHVAQGDAVSAEQELARVIEGYEEQRKEIQEESYRNSFFEKEQDIYDVAIDFAHARLGSPERAFDYSESSRARSLLDASTAGWSLSDDAESPDLRFAETSRPMSLREITDKVPAQAQILQYAVLKDKLVIWHVSKGAFDSRAVAIDIGELTGKVDRLLNLASRPPAGDDTQLREAAAELYDVLILPVLPLLDAGKQLCIVPDKFLNLLPFGALFSSASQEYLIETFTLVYAQSSNLFLRDTQLAQLKTGPKGERLLSVGNPLTDDEAFRDLGDLPASAREANEIAPLYESVTPLTGADATKAKVVREMRRADVLNFATHYVKDPDSPMRSKLLLARAAEGARANRQLDGALYAHEIYRIRPGNARLAVLSACQTGVEGYIKGEGALGLSRPFRAVGIPLVVASLWPVESESTAVLIVEFHRLRKREGLATADALRRAQTRMLHGSTPEYRHPYYWASFALTGGYSDY